MQKILNAITAKNHIDKGDSYYSTTIFDSKNLKIKINDFGDLSLPLYEDSIKKLIELSTKAKFGYKEDTIEDKKIRDTFEIKSDEISLNFENDSLEKILDNIKRDLDLSDNANLQADLHNMLIYSPGQFFKKHKDSEKSDGMIATMVLVLPYPHIGGNLLINYHDSKYKFISENINEKNIKCLAFYSDCEHEIKKVTDGYRVALTFNIILKNHNINLKTEINHKLKKEIEDYFKNYNQDDKYKMFAYLLDHEYSEHSLRWNKLKGSDSKNAADFLQIAKELGFHIYLTLIDFHQNWMMEEDDYDNGYNNVGEADLDELIDEEQHLHCWIDKDNKKLSYDDHFIKQDQICFPYELSEIDPSDSEYEGYMGNYGNTADYWYKRSAIVIWDKRDNISIKFKLNYDKELAKLMKMTKQDSNQSLVKEIIIKTGDLLYKDRHCEKNTRVKQLQNLLEIAVYIEDKALSLSFLDGFLITDIERIHIDSLIKIKEKYSDKYLYNLLEIWQNNVKNSYNRNNFINDVYDFLKYLYSKNFTEDLIQFFIKYQIEQLKILRDNIIDKKPGYIEKYRYKRIKYAKDLLKSSINFSGNTDLSESLVLHLIQNPTLYKIEDLTEIILSLKQVKKHQKPYNLLKNHLQKEINKFLAKGPRKIDDWSIDQELRCNCEHCKDIAKFLKSNETRKIISVVKDIRKYIIANFDDMNIPVTLEVLKQGSPHKLIITKNNELHIKAKHYFETIKNCDKNLSKIKNF